MFILLEFPSTTRRIFIGSHSLPPLWFAVSVLHGATYQRAMNYIFHEYINNIVEIYIDDVVVKSKSYEEHLADLQRTLECTRKHGLEMNPNKCAFGVSARQFLGFLHTREEMKWDRSQSAQLTI
jgi:hypothetical protein